MAKRVLMVITGILLVLCGIFSLSNPFANVLAIGIVIGALMVVSGIFSMVLYSKVRKLPGSSAWTLVEGILTLILGLFLLLSDSVLVSFAAMLPIFYASWLFISGITRVVKSFDIKKLGLSGWWVMLLNGILGVLLAVLLLSNYGLAFATLGTLISIMFIVRGIMDIAVGIAMES